MRTATLTSISNPMTSDSCGKGEGEKVPPDISSLIAEYHIEWVVWFHVLLQTFLGLQIPHSHEDIGIDDYFTTVYFTA